jgi:pyruvate dehydrogenase E1 component alpha subunit
MAVADEVAVRHGLKPTAVVAPDPKGRPAAAANAPSGQVERQRLRMMLLIRRFEERTYQEYTKPGQRIGGFCHLYSGQEAIAVGIASIFNKGLDHLINGYRCHGHSLALGMNPDAIMAEMFGKATGCAKGKGGSMHLFDAAAGNDGGHGIVAAQLPLGLGIAFAQWYKKTGGVTFCVMGDGAVNQGTHNETLNLASLLKAPCIFVVENNKVAMGTEVERHSAVTDLAQRGSGYNMPAINVDGNDVDAMIQELTAAADRARNARGPSYLVANTYRFRGHSMSDAMKYRTKEEAEQARGRDPIPLYVDRLKKKGLLNDEQLEQLQNQVNEQVEQSIVKADAAPQPALESRFEDVLVEKYPFIKR